MFSFTDPKVRTTLQDAVTNFGGKTVIEVLRRDPLCLRLTGYFYEMLVILF